ncbi:hypothetical protein Bca4012_004368 [Brassica carinata]|uniref:Uncharacterized protein n=1 Tax=Brassica carinata TaxID=52824 RepID=A0A8X7RUN7_BRACI|nr:hypothetical protein Bca52824_041205 [Brassica carinata]
MSAEVEVSSACVEDVVDDKDDSWMQFITDDAWDSSSNAAAVGHGQGGEIIHMVGGVVYLFRGRNYNYRTRPQYPLMLWEPAASVHPKLIQEIPEGLTKDEALEFMVKG